MQFRDLVSKIWYGLGLFIMLLVFFIAWIFTIKKTVKLGKWRYDLLRNFPSKSYIILKRKSFISLKEFLITGASIIGGVKSVAHFDKFMIMTKAEEVAENV